MFNSEKEFLFRFGWDDFFESQISNLISSSLFPARVVCEEKNLYRVQAGSDHVLCASVRGKRRFDARLRVDYPAVGDWVLVEVPIQSDRGVIHHVLKRKTLIHRKQVGSATDAQVLSTNVDYVFVTSSVNSDLNCGRIERYVAVAREAGAHPVILLTKADLCPENIDRVVNTVQVEIPGVSIHSISSFEFEKAAFLRGYLREGTTSIFLGSSGVGKSTLVNFLIGENHVKTQSVREGDGKGRHTTTSRNLYVSRYGGLIIDTPGMRELQLSDHDDGISRQFSDIEALIQSCRFGDCRHETEPGCAVKTARAEGSLAEERWNRYQKLKAEVRSGMRRQENSLAAEDRRIWKKKRIAARKGRRNGEMR